MVSLREKGMGESSAGARRSWQGSLVSLTRLLHWAQPVKSFFARRQHSIASGQLSASPLRKNGVRAIWDFAGLAITGFPAWLV